ncbi:hypothetical protein HH308_19215 [Gordonia sp. TBRC 11910]|uniref:Uncharacterized protein n=1 Tax=Gordonia asplenii TaxID=2725283 RepID=A0A848KYX5_9ACTN|nr:hypothetical protein [Gordonia asplenii]NMO03347.1 hypothetical protein [Gordonia asplenii]
MTQDRDHGATAGADPTDLMREVLLGLANQIDSLAAMFVGTPGAGADGLVGPDLSGDISALLGEIGELLARLIATLIAVLEALAQALRGSSSATDAAVPRQYQPIAVRIAPTSARD